jgi:hypothetical protein
MTAIQVHLENNTKIGSNIKKIKGSELYVLAKHHKICTLANWSRPSNICSRAPGRATEEQAKQLNIHILGESST